MKRPLDHALALAAMGFYLFPIRPGSRTPATRHGHHNATVDPARIAAWWKREPRYDLAIVCGRLLVVDIDGDVGEASLKKLEREFGALPTNTPQVKTKRGRHIYLTVPRPTSTRLSTLGKGIDWKCHGGWVVAPPSKHKSGARYRWTVAPWEARVQPAPDWLVEALGAPGSEIPPSRAKEVVEPRARQAPLQKARPRSPAPTPPTSRPLKKNPLPPARPTYVEPDPLERHDASKADLAFACHRVREGATDDEIAEEIYDRPKCQGIGVTLAGSARIQPRNVDAYVADVIRGAHKLTRLVGAVVTKWVREIYGGGQKHPFGRFRVLVLTDDGEIVVTDVVAPTAGYAGAVKRWRACFGGLAPGAIFKLSQAECGALFADRFVVRVEHGSVCLMANVKNVNE